MSRTLTKWRIWCNDELDWTEGWLENPAVPTTCFNVNTHSVNPNSAQDLDVINERSTQIDEEHVPVGKKAGGGHVRATSVRFEDDAAPGVYALAVGTHNMTLSWPYVVYIYGVESHTTAAQKGDRVDVCVNREALIGALTAPVTAGDSTFTVDETTVDNAYVGIDLALDDRPSGSLESVGEVVSIDKNALTVTVTGSASRAFSPLSPTLVRVSAHPIKDWYIGNPGLVTLGAFKIGGTRIEANYPVTVTYENNQASGTTDFTFNIELTH